MQILKIFTTLAIVILMLIILLFCKGLTWEKNSASIIGFSSMEIVYVLSLICIWS